MNKLKIVTVSLLLLSLGVVWFSNETNAQGSLTPKAYLPMLLVADACPTTSNESYSSGIAFQFDQDNPVRPAFNHADKNIALRNYTLNTASNLQRELVDYGSDDPTQPPQLATFFSPNQVPNFSGFYQVHQWNYAPSPTPGVQAEPISFPKVTAISFDLDSGTSLYAPSSGYNIGGGVEVIVLFADEDTVTLHYTREDSAARGYTLHIDNICTNPNLLALYNNLDRSDGPRYEYPSNGYDLPTLPAGQIFGTTSNEDMVVAIADTGAFQDPRSCNEWWQIRPGYTGSCPPQQ